MGFEFGANEFENWTSMQPGVGPADADNSVRAFLLEAAVGVAQGAPKWSDMFDEETEADWMIEDIVFVGDVSEDDAGDSAAPGTYEPPADEGQDEASVAGADAPGFEDGFFRTDDFVFQIGAPGDAGWAHDVAGDSAEQVIVFECGFDAEAGYESSFVDTEAPEQPAMPHDQGDLL